MDKSTVRFVLACVACVQDTHGQCRNPRCKGSNYCEGIHKKMADAGNAPPEAMPAEIVLVKRKISLSRAKKLMAMGIREEEGMDPLKKLDQATADAKRQRRSATTYGDDRRDGGTSVINGADGAKKITIIRALVDLKREYEITSIHLEPTRDQNPHMRMLIVAYTLRNEKLAPVCTLEKTPELWKLVISILNGVFDVWVYANAPNPETGIVLHTVNLGWLHSPKTPQDPAINPDGHLRFTDKPGAWDVEEETTHAA